MEALCCGAPTYDTAVWKANTTYEGGYSVSHPTVALFWAVLEAWTPEQQGRWVRFCWGRSRLPQGARWPPDERMRLTRMAGGAGAVPRAHTCSFECELPEYDNAEDMRKGMEICINFGLVGVLEA